MIWKQIKHIAVVLDKTKRKDVWDVAALGSDYDGLVDPPNGYWTSDDFPILAFISYLYIPISDGVKRRLLKNMREINLIKLITYPRNPKARKYRRKIIRILPWKLLRNSCVEMQSGLLKPFFVEVVN